MTTSILPYDDSNPKDIERYAKLLIGKRFKEIGNNAEKRGGKGKLGQYLEENYFNYKLNSDSRADFYKAGVELKTSPIKKISKNRIRAKERIVLNIINYMEIINEKWADSSLVKKNYLLLLIFYLYEEGLGDLDYIIKIVTLWHYDEKDGEIIRQDWEKIVSKIKNGKAHELSEGDTLYLGACTKGVDKSSERNQPFSKEKAKQRAFCFKQNYVNSIIERLNDSESAIKDISILKKKSFEEIILERINKYVDESISNLHKELNISIKPTAKNYCAILASKMLGLKKNKIDEFEKAEIEIKSIRLKHNGNPDQNMSFPAFKFKEVASEEWEDSQLINIVEKKYLFMVFQYDKDKNLYFKGGFFWNMPHKDILQVKMVWFKTKKIINEGVKIWDAKGKTKNNLPKKSENQICHVRPHTSNKENVDILPDGRTLTKQCFWFNGSYLKEQIKESQLDNISTK